MLVKSGKIRGELIKYEDGVGGAIWSIMNDKDEEMGICFDFTYDDIHNIIEVMNILKNTEPMVYEQTHEEKERRKEIEKRTQSSWYKLMQTLSRIQVTFSPFKWGFGLDDIPIIRDSRKFNLLVSGVFRIGPFMFAW